MAKIRIGLIILALLLVFSFMTQSKGEIDMSLYLSSPSLSHPFGCDSLGRDLLQRTSYGFLISALVVSLSSLIALVTALFLAFVIRNTSIIGSVILSLVKAIRTVPSVVLALFLLSFSPRGGLCLIFTLSLSSSSLMTLLILPLLSSLEGEEYIIAERSLGLREGKIYMTHIIPSLMRVIREEFVTTLIRGVITESSISFLGFGLDPSLPTLGRLLSEGRSTMLTYPHTMIFPSLVLFLMGLGILLVSRGLSELDTPSE